MIALVGLAVWVAAAAVDALVILRLARRRPAPGLNTVAEVDTFVRELRRPFSVPLAPLMHHVPTEAASRLRTVPDVPVPAGVEGFAIERAPVEVTLTRTEVDAVPALTLDLRTPIYDALERERHRRVVALRMPTLEMRVVFDALVDAWLCSHCEVEDCRGCPGCSCSCRLEAVAA